jgi:hypothetical protein
MKAKYHKRFKSDNYLKQVTKTNVNFPEMSRHHLLPLQFFPDSNFTVDLPYQIHTSLHKNFNNYQIILDPVGTIIKCILTRTPLKRDLSLEDLLISKGIRVFNEPKNKLLSLIHNGFAFNI